MVVCNPAQTPMNENMRFSARISPDTPQGALAMKFYPYSALIREALYLAVATRPDIAYDVDGRFVENPGMDHWHAAKRVLLIVGVLYILGLSIRVIHLTCSPHSPRRRPQKQYSSLSVMFVVARLLWTRSLRLLPLDNVDGGCCV